jgi:phage terminase small subunit
MARKPKSKLLKVRTKAMPRPRKLLPNGLTQRQNAFINEYLIDLNATQAAIRAGYSKHTAGEQAARLLANVRISEIVKQRTEERAEKTQIDAAWLLDRLAAESVADANDLYDNEGHFKPVSEWPLIWRQGLVQGIEMGDVTIGSGRNAKTVRRPVKVRLSDRAKRLELVGKHVGVQAFRDRVDHGLTGEAEKTIVDATMSIEKAAQLYREKLG